MVVKKKRICISCENESYIWSKNRCKTCFNKDFPPKSIKKVSEKGKIAKEKKKEYTQKQFELFQEIWNERPHYCFESGQFLGFELLSTMFHHCLYKSQYPQFALNKENIVLVDPNIHQLTHISIDKTPKIKQYTIELKKKLLKF